MDETAMDKKLAREYVRKGMKIIDTASLPITAIKIATQECMEKNKFKTGEFKLNHPQLEHVLKQCRNGHRVIWGPFFFGLAE